MRITFGFRCLLATVAILAVVVAYGWYSLQHIQIDASGLAPFVNKLAATVEVATLSVPRCPSTAEYTHAGDRKLEATMLYVASIVDFYETTFGRLPNSIADLDKLPTFRNAEQLNGQKVKTNCSIQPMQSIGAYVVSCGGKMPSQERLDPFLRGVLREQTFVSLDGTEVLYVPQTKGCS
jgi:hypothetical protein